MCSITLSLSDASEVVMAKHCPESGVVRIHVSMPLAFTWRAHDWATNGSLSNG